MTIQELERQLLTLDRNERIRIIQIIAQSLTLPSPVVDNISLNGNSTSNLDQTSIVDFFRNSPLAEAINSGELDLSRDQTIEADRFVCRSYQSSIPNPIHLITQI